MILRSLVTLGFNQATNTATPISGEILVRDVLLELLNQAADFL